VYPTAETGECVKLYPLRNEQGEMFAFEIDSSWFFLSSSKGMARFLRRCSGVEIVSVRRHFHFGNEVHVEFGLHGDQYEVWEPYGDSSRLWIGPKDSPHVHASIDHLASYVSGHWPGPISSARAKLFDKVLAMFR